MKDIDNQVSKFYLSTLVAFFVYLSPVFAQQTADQSSDTGVMPSAQSPDGISMNFQPDQYTGRFTYSVPINVASGRQGAKPTLALGYNSASGNGWCGVGWSLETGYIQRDVRHGVPIQWAAGSTNSLPKFDDSKGFISNFGGISGTLVRIGSTNQNPIVYRQQVDTTFITYNYYTNNYWQVIDKSGNKFFFGEGITNQMENYKTNWVSNVGASTFRWALDKVIDVNGNETVLNYITVSNQLYLTNILYNANINSPSLAATSEIDFILTNRVDRNITFASGYRITQTKLLSEIDVKAGGLNVRKYTLNYIQSTSTFRSLLNSITEYGSDYTSSLPPITFGYQVQNLGFGPTNVWPGIYSEGLGDVNSNSPRFMNGQNYSVEMIDMDGDGLLDRVMEKANSPYTNYFAFQRNTGTGFAPITTNYQWGTIDNAQGQTDAGWNSPTRTDGSGNYDSDLVDLNGDGYPDRVMRNESGNVTNWFVQFNSGIEGSNGFNPYSTWPITAQAGATSYTWGEIRTPHNVDLIDINGDGLPDRVMTMYNAPYDRFKVAINNGNGFQTNLVDWVGVDGQGQSDMDWNAIANIDTSGTYQGWHSVFIDINGDGLPDRVMSNLSPPYTNFIVQYNNGAGFEPDESWGPVDTNWTTVMTQSSGDVFNMLVDVNGDGLPDRVMHPNGALLGYSTNWLVQLNTGSGFAPAVSWSPVNSLSESGWDHITHLDSSGHTSVDFFDINGDGLPDRVMRSPTAPYTNWLVQLNLGPFPDLLNVVSNGYGGSAQIGYVASTTLDNRNTNWISDPWLEGTKSLLPFNVWVVSQIVTHDGIGGGSTNKYAFKGGYFNESEHEFRGFSQCAVTDPYGTKTITYYHQSGGRNNAALGEYNDQGSESKKGTPFRIDIVGNDGTTNKITLNKVEEIELNTNGWYFPFISQTIVMNYEGLSTYRASAQQFNYDTNTGNILENIDMGEVTNVAMQGQTFTDIGNDSVYTWTSYAAITNIYNKPSDIKITSDNAGANRLRETLMYYDSHGNMTSNAVWSSTSANFITTSSTIYDQYGNPLKTTDAAGISTATTYDAAYDQYPIVQIVGTFTNYFAYDVRSGQTSQAIDAKGLVASNAFDVFYRPVATYISTNAFGVPVLWKTKDTYSSGGVINYVSYNYIYKQVNNVIDPVNGFESYTYFDGDGKVIQARTEAETGQFRVSNTSYDLRGNTCFNTLSYFASGAGFSVLNGNQLGSLTEYDDIGRAFRLTPAVLGTFTNNILLSTANTGGDTGSPVGAITTAFRDVNNPWATVVTDSDGIIKKSNRDAYGHVIKITDVNTNGNYNTEYLYDVLGDITNVIDNVGNVTTIQYDSLGRKILLKDPDLGIWSYGYDSDGRLIQQIDARTNRIAFLYADQIGRLSSKQIYNCSNELVGTISYIYDQSDDPNYTVFKGQLYKVVDTEGYQRSGYDVRGRVTRTGRFLNVNAIEYVIQTSYDDADRLMQATYPGGEVITGYSYDSVGHLIQVRSLAGTGTQEIFYSSQGFNANGQPIGYTNGNGDATVYNYYTNSGRLHQTWVTNGTNSLQKLSYTYDPASDLNSIADGVYIGAASSSVSSLSYDSLYRLTSINSAANGLKSYGYDSTGNILTNNDFGAGVYSYGSVKPHAVTGANGVSYAYDACGNMTARGNQALFYDEQNQLVKVAKTNDSVLFGYDFNGQRLWRYGTNGYSIWIGGLYEVNNGKVLCHIFAGSTRVATFEPLCGGLWSKAFGEKNWFAVSSDTKSILIWPFQNGRGKTTIFVGTWIGIFCILFFGSRKMHFSLLEVRAGVRPHKWWRRATSVACISSVMWNSVGNADLVTYNPVFYYYHVDNVSSSNVLTDRNGNLVQEYVYSPFGNTTFVNNSAAYAVSNRYTGQIADDETGLYYYGARYYDPQLGRFIQPDTIVQSPATAQTFNRYSYCDNNPINFADPTGHFFIALLVCIIIGAIVGGASAAATGGNIGLGILGGAIGGLFAGVGGILVGEVGAVVGGAIGGVVNAEITGGNVGLSALTGAISGAISFSVGQINFPSNYVGELAGYTAYAAGGALGGGIGAQLDGGNFLDGAEAGAIGGAIGDGVNTFADSLLSPGGSINSDEEKYFQQRAENAYTTSGGFPEGVDYDPQDGLSATFTPAQGNYPAVLAFRGTEFTSLVDWENNFEQALGFSSSQYEQARSLSIQVFNATNGNVVIVGHSLGGELADAGAVATGARAVTFNAAGLNSFKGSAANIQNYYIRGEVLTSLQSILPIPRAWGTQIPYWNGSWGHSISNFR